MGLFLLTSVSLFHREMKPFFITSANLFSRDKKLRRQVGVSQKRPCVPQKVNPSLGKKAAEAFASRKEEATGRSEKLHKRNAILWLSTRQVLPLLSVWKNAVSQSALCAFSLG